MELNIRLRDKFGTDGGAWACDVDNVTQTQRTTAYAKQTLAECQAEEPAADWHLETRGTVATWHRVTL